MKKGNYKYLLRLYTIVDGYLAENTADEENLPEVVVAFCTFVEKILKIKLYIKNPVLIFENTRIKDADALVAVVKRTEEDIETIKIEELIHRYRLVFSRQVSEDEALIMRDLYRVRNHFVHDHKPDDNYTSIKEDTTKKMGTVWEKISKIAISILGKEQIKASKPVKKYSKEELENVLIEQVKKKIGQSGGGLTAFHRLSLGLPVNYQTSAGQFSASEKCPRCGELGFARGITGENQGLVTLSIYSPATQSDLYVCRHCNLELTEKEYEIAKKI